MAKLDDMMAWLARTYVHAMNCIHYSGFLAQTVKNLH
jgi:pyruvate-formate lyase